MHMDAVGGGPWAPSPEAYCNYVATATPVFVSADESILMVGGHDLQNGILACVSSSVIVHVLVLHYSVSCVEHSQV